MHLQKKLRNSMALGLVVMCAAFLFSCGKKTETVKETNAAAAPSDTSSAETSGVTDTSGTSAAEEKESSGTGAAGKSGSESAESAGSGESRSRLTAGISVYEKAGIRIEYPQITGMTDSSKQEKLNDHLKENALAVLSNYPDSMEPVNQDEDALQISCEVVSADSERVTAVYKGSYDMKGAAHPSNVFYTNTVDVSTLKDVSLKDIADPHTLAEYALSRDVVLKNADADLTRAYQDWQKSTTVEQYEECLENADFPLRTGADGKNVTWPDSFSYEAEGTVFFTVPVPHAMGDYVVVEYETETK